MHFLIQQLAVLPSGAHEALEHGRLPLVVLIVLLVGMFGTLAFATAKFVQVLHILNGPPPFPTHAFTTIGGMLVFFGIMIVAICRLALGMEWPDGYDFVLGSMVSVILGVAAWGVGKRFTDERYVEAKERGKASSPSNPSVNVEGDASISTTTERPVPAPSRKTDVVVPQAGVVSTDPAVVAAVQGIAAAQKDPRLPSPLDDERDA